MMACPRDVVLVLAGLWCVSVMGGVPHTAAVSDERNERRDQMSVPPPLTSCRGINSLLRLLRSALEDLRALQESYSSEGRLLKARNRMKERARAAQWARKLRRRLLRLCPRQVGAVCGSRSEVFTLIKEVCIKVTTRSHPENILRLKPKYHLVIFFRSLYHSLSQQLPSCSPSLHS